MARFVIAPLWQGSSSSRAMQLVDGAEAIAGDLPASASTHIEVPAEAGESLGTAVRRLSSLQRATAAIRDAVLGGEGPAIVIGGDCSVTLGAVEAVAGEDLAVLWLDAHADLHIPDTSPSGALHGMVLRAILGDGVEGARLPAGAVTPDRVILAGVRELDEPERAAIAALGIRLLSPADLAVAERVADAVAATGARRVYIHLDVDVLDPADLEAMTYPVPFGPRATEVIAAIRAVRARMPIAGASLTEFAPSSSAAAASDLPTVLRLIGALA